MTVVDLTSVFSGLGTAKKSMQAEYIRPGKYWMRINKCKIDTNRKKVIFAAVEMTVVHSLDDDTGKGHRLGDDVTWYIDQNSDYFASEIRTFVSNVMAVPFEQVQEDDAIQVFGEDQPLAGTLVEVHARTVTLKSGGDFTKVSFKREVTATEALGTISEEVRSNYFPGNILEQLAQMEAEQPAAVA